MNLSIAKDTAEILLQIKAIKLNCDNHFVWASGWYSPIYCDNRKILSFPKARRQICSSFVELIKQKFPKVEVIAGVATGAIAHGVLVAEQMNKPFIYVRSEAKSHGLTNLIEGNLKSGDKVVVIEDLISTGGSSLAAVEALRAAGADVLGMMAIFTYGFPKAVENFENAQCTLHTLSSYPTLLEVAKEQDYIKPEEMETLKQWREEPSVWKK